jgi:hypothetical protein
VTESLVLPPICGAPEVIHLSEKYRLKAWSCEKLGHAAADRAIQLAWAEIAIEWHALANRTAQGHDDIAVA